MNEWKQLLEQTHPQFKTMMTVDEAINQQGADRAGEVSHNEIEWISPTHKLQDKIENIPDKFGFKIGEAADYVGVKQHVLRYWESEFDILKPKKSKNGQRMYTKKDVETALMIKKLLHDDRFSIEGAQAALKKLRQQVREAKPNATTKTDSKVVVSRGSLEFAEGFLASIREARLKLNLD
jgi:DNA-binding transcriptional MerR regulator